ncbi:MAG: hypothetical protein U9Q15_01225 [Patescibacteria group bacterium]|nr:hypothetical protein [Patescibacteria group bacterium]
MCCFSYFHQDYSKKTGGILQGKIKFSCHTPGVLLSGYFRVKKQADHQVLDPETSSG